MRVLQGPPLRPIFLLDEIEIEGAAPLPSVPELPFGMFIDDRLRVHFELNHALAALPAPGWRALVSPMSRYRAIAPHLLAQSLLKTERRLIGGLHGVYRARERYTVVITTGVLPARDLGDVPAEIRAKAFDVMSRRLHELNRWLGADFVHSGPTVIPSDVMRRIGWEEYRPRKWRNLWDLYRTSFPMCLRRRVRVYVVRYRPGAVLE